MSDLAKRRAGAPLSDAERQQRREAARARWAIPAAAATTLAAASGAGALYGLHRLGDKARQEESAAAARLEAAKQRNAARMAAAARVRDSIASNLKGRTFLPTAIKAMRNIDRSLIRELRDHLANPTGDETKDEAREASIMERLAENRHRLADLIENGRDPKRQKRASSVSVPKKPAYERRGRYRVVWHPGHAEELDDLLSSQGSAEARQIIGARSRKELERRILEAHASDGKIKPPNTLGYGYSVQRPEELERVVNREKITRKHRFKAKGYPDAGARRILASDIKRYVERRAKEWEAAETARAAERIAKVPGIPASALRRLNLIRNPKVKAAVLAGGALLGGLTGWTVAHHVEKLAKADDKPPLEREGRKVEAPLSERLARVFRGWKDDLTQDLLSPKKGAITSTMLTDMDHAMRPLSTASRAGLSQPVPGTVVDAGGPKSVIFSFQARSPLVEDFIDRYRQSRIVALVEDQKEAIKAILIDAAKSGMSPDDMARRIRKTIGLTPNQASQVMNYTSELEDLNPAALKRQLRDKRYDRTIQAAIDSQTPLSADQIQKMTDAYHRKYLAYRAMTIARTEGVGAANNGHVAAVEDFLDRFPGYTVVKTWIATEDERTRPDHIGLHNKSVVGLHTPFVAPSGARIRWPHDPDGDANQVVNCRCTLACRLVPRSLAAERGTESVQPLRDMEPA